ncbi:receptor activity-modifying protein 1 isoform X2 [Nycticebus coucang]|uniref:receptor activity-modifying protein 1 isoform X2 n=1 Tax=Nycticebus coucang TaxID=9470 RepID=UPI00234C5E72|nr:receptor activity-modifying protein 1 isoform X2 [Nycticebus coucang]
MALGLRDLQRRGLWLLLAHHIFLVTACKEAQSGVLMQEICLSRFKMRMDAIGERLWCHWGKTIRSRTHRTDPVGFSSLLGARSPSLWGSGQGGVGHAQGHPFHLQVHEARHYDGLAPVYPLLSLRGWTRALSFSSQEPRPPAGRAQGP